MDLSDNRTLIEQLKKGNELAYVQLMDHYHQPLCVYALGLSQDPDRAEDIVQNVFVRCWEQRKSLRPDFSIKSYLYRSVHNEFIDQYRKQRSVMALEKKYIAALDTIIEEDEGRLQQLITLVKREIEALPPKCKQIFVLSKTEGLTNLEIAEHLGISIKTVEAQITNAFKQIRKKVGDKMEGIFFLLFGQKVC